MAHAEDRDEGRPDRVLPGRKEVPGGQGRQHQGRGQGWAVDEGGRPDLLRWLHGEGPGQVTWEWGRAVSQTATLGSAPFGRKEGTHEKYRNRFMCWIRSSARGTGLRSG